MQGIFPHFWPVGTCRIETRESKDLPTLPIF